MLGCTEDHAVGQDLVGDGVSKGDGTGSGAASRPNSFRVRPTHQLIVELE